jgi:diguanylate cyclase (GGDEF)-like protein
MSTLARQLLGGVSLIFLAGLLGIAAIYVVNSRSYLQQQLDSHAQDAATSLGLSLGARTDPDRVFVETTINAVFDRGHYERIVFADAEGRILVDKRLPAAAVEVPGWFARLLPLEPPTAASLVSQGWQQLGRVSVTSHARLAYRQLWKTGYETLAWLALIYALALAAVRAFLAGLLKPLRNIEQTAAAISARDYRRIDVLPRARELRVVVEAMNVLSAKVHDAIDAETSRAEQLRREAFHDVLTGLWNRRGLEQQYDARVLHDRDVFSAALALIELADLSAFNRTHGYARGDEVLKLIAEALETWAAEREAMVARWAGATFVVVAVNEGPAAAAAMAAALCRTVEARLGEQDVSQVMRFNCGAAAFDHGKPDLGGLLGAADGALGRAQLDGTSLAEVTVLEPGDAAPGSMEWRDRLTRLLAEDRIVLFGQPALALPGRETLHVEVTSRIRDDDGTTLPAARFLPMASRHGLVAQLDRRMLERVLAWLDARADVGQVAVNISAASTMDAEFMQWLAGRLDAERRLAATLCFEVAESGVMRDPDAAVAFSGAVRRLGARFAVDGFGVHRESLQLLKRLLPDYVKLSAAHTRSLAADASSRFFVESVVRIARSLDIRVIAQAVEAEELVPLLVELGIAGFQGYLQGAPAPLR